jgi:ring-1,2-phenylacetyl-CoA epoxidase subunit PaaC
MVAKVMVWPTDDEIREALFEFLLQLGDNALILGHRLSEWCGKAPALEEDIALANTALDLIGHAQLWLGYAAEVEGEGRTADDLAFHRDPHEFRCCLLVQQPNGDFADTLMRQFLFDCYHRELLHQLSQRFHMTAERRGPSLDPRVAAIAAKAFKEVTYHQERSADLVVRLGDGSPESHARMQAALDRLWRFTSELTSWTKTDSILADAGGPKTRRHIFPDPGGINPAWVWHVNKTLTEATLTIPEDRPRLHGGKTGQRHSEHLGHLLAVMQSLPRAHPDATW